MTTWTITPWACVCGRIHAPWWRTTPPPSCPNSRPDEPEEQPAMDLAEAVARMFNRPFPWPPEEDPGA